MTAASPLLYPPKTRHENDFKKLAVDVPHQASLDQADTIVDCIVQTDRSLGPPLMPPQGGSSRISHNSARLSLANDQLFVFIVLHRIFILRTKCRLHLVSRCLPCWLRQGGCVTVDRMLASCSTGVVLRVDPFELFVDGGG